jgi:hypothetical protein
MAGMTQAAHQSTAQRINVKEERQICTWCDRFGCTASNLKAAVEKVGVMAEDVERELSQALIVRSGVAAQRSTYRYT